MTENLSDYKVIKLLVSKDKSLEIKNNKIYDNICNKHNIYVPKKKVISLKSI